MVKNADIVELFHNLKIISNIKMKEQQIENFIDNIHLGKWEDMMPKIPSNSIDIVITSPPYNISLGDNKNRNKDKGYDICNDNLSHEDYLKWMYDLFCECNRVLKVGGRMCINIGDGANGSIPTHSDFTQLINKIGTEPYPKKDIVSFKMMTTIIWDKQQIGGSTSWGSWQSPSQPSFPTQFEFILVFGKGTKKHEGDNSKITVSKEDFIRNSRALWTFPPDTQMIKLYDHPATFPEELPRRLIDQLTYEDDIVLDCFSGSGTTCVVAKKMKRHYIGIEMSEKYYNKSLERLDKIPCTERIKIDGKEVDMPVWMT